MGILLQVDGCCLVMSGLRDVQGASLCYLWMLLFLLTHCEKNDGAFLDSYKDLKKKQIEALLRAFSLFIETFPCQSVIA